MTSVTVQLKYLYLTVREWQIASPTPGTLESEACFLPMIGYHVPEHDSFLLVSHAVYNAAVNKSKEAGTLLLM